MRICKNVIDKEMYTDKRTMPHKIHFSNMFEQFEQQKKSAEKNRVVCTSHDRYKGSLSSLEYYSPNKDCKMQLNSNSVYYTIQYTFDIINIKLKVGKITHLPVPPVKSFENTGNV